jgi:hypothetical protein
MDKNEIVKFEIFTWKKISHGLFDYDNKNCNQTNLKVDQISHVFIRVDDTVRAFPSFEEAVNCKKNEMKGRPKENSNKITFLVCMVKEKEQLKLYSYNQLEIILNYFEENQNLQDVDANLHQVFEGCKNIKSAKSELKFLGFEDFSKDLWKVAKSLDWRKSSKHSKVEWNGVEVKEGNIIKMGRLKMKLIGIQLSNVAKSEHQIDEEDEVDHNKDISFQISEKNDEIPPCRFCLSNVMDDQNNPLINPCHWKGTQGLLHLEWLKSWMSSKKSHRVFSTTSEMFTWKSLSCELCSVPYPFKIWFNGKHVSLLEYDRPNEKHLAFETFLKEGCEKSTSKSIYILRVTGRNKFKIGRSHDVEFHIEDISVSRFHGELEIGINNSINIKDVKSKFGTQILSKSAQIIDHNDMTKNMFQVGRTWLMWVFATNSQSSGFWNCLCGKPKNTSDPRHRNYKEIDEGKKHFLDKNFETKLENDIESSEISFIIYRSSEGSW